MRYAYGENRAVDGVSLEVRPGEIVGLLGPNGAGKTTTISMIAGLLAPQSGQVLLFGQDAARSLEARRRLGVVPQEIAFYEELSATENLRFWGRVYGLSGAALGRAVGATLEEVGLTDRAKERAKTFSGGLKRRLNMGIGLVHSPDLLLLDEPTVGIDPQARLRILDVVRAQARAGRAVLYTSHYLDEAEALCDRIAIVDHGRVLAQGTLADLRRLAGEGPVLHARTDLDAEAGRRIAERVPGTTVLATAEGSLSFTARDAAACSRLVGELFQAGRRVEDLRIQEPSLESLFLKLTGRELRD